MLNVPENHHVRNTIGLRPTEHVCVQEQFVVTLADRQIGSIAMCRRPGIAALYVFTPVAEAPLFEDASIFRLVDCVNNYYRSLDVT